MESPRCVRRSHVAHEACNGRSAGAAFRMSSDLRAYSTGGSLRLCDQPQRCGTRNPQTTSPLSTLPPSDSQAASADD